MSKPIVSIVGRPNVGKSTLFNRILGARKAIVLDQPGVTRDRHYAEVDWAGREFILIDTGGFVPESSDVFEAAVREQVHLSIEEAAVVLLLVDGQDGILPMDREIARMLRKSAKRVLLVVNKIDGPKHDQKLYEFHELGLGNPYPISAISGRQTGDLLDVVVEGFPEQQFEEEDESFRLAIIGRPNVGKSSLANAFLGKPRSIVTDIPGTTRDALDSLMKFHGREITLIDTAGLRRKSKVKENVEFFSTVRTLKSIQRCHVALVLIDAVDGLTHQDIDVISQAVEYSKGIVIGVNKWDLVEKDTNTAHRLETEIHERIKTFDYIPIVFISTLTKQRIAKALDMCLQVHEERSKRISTAELNDRLLPLLAEKPPPSTPTGREVKIRYATQVRNAPPVVVFFTNHPRNIPESYRRFVERAIRDIFGFKGVPLTVQFRNSHEKGRT